MSNPMYKFENCTVNIFTSADKEVAVEKVEPVQDVQDHTEPVKIGYEMVQKKSFLVKILRSLLDEFDRAGGCRIKIGLVKSIFRIINDHSWIMNEKFRHTIIDKCEELYPELEKNGAHGFMKEFIHTHFSNVEKLQKLVEENLDENVDEENEVVEVEEDKENEVVEVEEEEKKEAVTDPKYKVGDVIDVMDFCHKWYQAEVIDFKVGDFVQVHYLNWSKKWDERINVDSDRLAPKGTYTTRPYNPIENAMNDLVTSQGHTYNLKHLFLHLRDQKFLENNPKFKETVRAKCETMLDQAYHTYAGVVVPFVKEVFPDDQTLKELCHPPMNMNKAPRQLPLEFWQNWM